MTQYFTQLNTYHVVLEVPPELQGDPDTLEQDLHQLAGDRAAGAAVDLRAISTPITRRYLSINHQGQFPAVTLSFNLAPGVALGQAVDAINRRIGDDAICRSSIDGTFQGTAQAFQSFAEERALSDPGGAGGGLHHPGHAL